MLRFSKPMSQEFPIVAHTPLTVVLTNWKRPKNLRSILDAISMQTVKPTVFLWNNGAEFSHPAVDWCADSSRNLACLPRWWMASCAHSDAVCILDDDLNFLDDRFLEDMLAVLHARPARSIVGLFGMRLHAEREYRYCTHLRPSMTDDQTADIIKGRFMMMRTADLSHVHLQPSPAFDALMTDDIFVSGALGNGKPGMHFIPRGFASRVQELPDHDSLYDRADHWANREKARRNAFPAS